MKGHPWGRTPRLAPGITSALLAAFLFGASAPCAKRLLEHVGAVALAGLLYLGAGAGLTLLWLWRRAWDTGTGAIERQDIPWLAAAIVFGGVLGPVLLMLGLARMPAASASLLLNLENVLTALIAWFAFHEHHDRRIVWGMVLIALAGMLLARQGYTSLGSVLGPLAVVGACLCWALDNNLTRHVAAGDPVLIAAVKGVVAGSVNVTAAMLAGERFPPFLPLATAALVGFLGYGVSLVFFVTALRHIGTSRTSAYFSAAPFVGAAIALAWLHESEGAIFWVAAGFMAIGLWLHLAERHVHPHDHEALAHNHRHVHDAHHGHAHDFPWDGREPHAHRHIHEPLTHSHPHYPDIHHRHGH
ncbi:DMT family transporter [Acidiferrobacter sp.]|uniref:DMT family transporter n=1 Tax=Acidiferrobacter sp. TaxID=1872107 RepID=UPI00260DBC02|nr:DMT family transporter [Acidiferrobacter sp.]